jgi:chitinase
LAHVNFAFASIDPRTHRLVPAHPEDVALYREFTALQSKGVKTWIAVGAWDMSDPGTPTHTAWSDMASAPENRKAFVESAVSFMEQHGFQGLDLDWEYPVDDKRGGGEDDTRNQIDLVVDLRKAFGNRFGLSSVLAPDFWYLRHMDPKAMEAQVDWFNFMAYDLHGAWDGKKPHSSRAGTHTDLL